MESVLLRIANVRFEESEVKGEQFVRIRLEGNLRSRAVSRLKALTEFETVNGRRGRRCEEITATDFLDLLEKDEG